MNIFSLALLTLYYADDYSLAEIAEEFNISRQAVYDNIKRTEKVLESYEEKLHLFSNYVVRNQLLEELMKKYSTDQYLITKLQKINSFVYQSRVSHKTQKEYSFDSFFRFP